MSTGNSMTETPSGLTESMKVKLFESIRDKMDQDHFRKIQLKIRKTTNDQTDKKTLTKNDLERIEEKK